MGVALGGALVSGPILGSVRFGLLGWSNIYLGIRLAIVSHLFRVLCFFLFFLFFLGLSLL